jgi:multisubunit Na+/H+ antiporter MnhG subunit
MSHFSEHTSPSQAKDAGLALVLICLIIGLTSGLKQFLLIGTILLVVVMTAPKLFRPFAKFWFGFSHILGTVVSRVLLTVLFYCMVTPVGAARRLLGKDAMQLGKWKQGRDSVFNDRNHQFTRQDLDHPY